MILKCIIIVISLSLFSFESNAQTRKKGRSSGPDNIKVGAIAPDFEISKLDSFLKTNEKEKAEKVKLSEEYKSKPVLLLFGSYT